MAEEAVAIREDDSFTPPSAIRTNRLVEDFIREASASYASWNSGLNAIHATVAGLKRPNLDTEPHDIGQAQALLAELRSWATSTLQQGDIIVETVQRIRKSVSDVSTQRAQLKEILESKREAAGVQRIIVESYPPEKVSELAVAVGAALAGAGTIDFGVTRAIASSTVLWVIGIVTLGVAFWFRIRHQLKWQEIYEKRLDPL